MDLSKILGDVENKDALIKQIEAEVGREFVPRAEFNTKNDALKALEKQFDETSKALEGLKSSSSKHEQTVSELTGKIKSYEADALKSRIAIETGLPYELSGRLSGEDEDSIRRDAENLAKFIEQKQPLPPLKSTEKPLVSGEDAAYKTLLDSFKGE